MSGLIWEKDCLTQRQVENLRRHKYKSEGSSILEPFFQKFWVQAVEHVPVWIAPNVLTLAGLFSNFVACIPLVVFCPTFQERPPTWGLVGFAISFFIYQTLDALDGKHARRIGLSSPMGELFDHGCDAVNTVIVAMVYNISLRLGVEPSINFYSFSNACFCFYLAHWHTYCTGSLHFGFVDVTEAQCVVILQLLFTAVAGVEFWDQEVMIVGEMRNLMIVVATFAIIPAILSHLKVVFVDGGCGRAGSTVADSSVLSPAKNIVSAIVLMWLIQHRSQTPNIAEHYTLLYYLLFGFYFIKITCNLVVAHMCKSELSFWDSVMFGPGMVFMNQYMNYLLPEYYVLLASVIWCAADWVVYVSRLLSKLSSELDLPVLSVPAKIVNSHRSATPSSPNHSSKSSSHQSKTHKSVSNRDQSGNQSSGNSRRAPSKRG